MSSIQTPDTADTASVEVIRRFVDQILNRGHFQSIADIVHADYRYEGPDGAPLHGPDQLKALIAGYRAGFSDFHVDITSEVADGGHVAATMVMTGTHDGEFDGIPATGRRLDLPVAVFSTVVDGRIVDEREFYDTGTMLAQLGLAPTDGEAPA